MAEIPPWLRPLDFVGAMSAGSAAGAHIASIGAGLQEAAMRNATSLREASMRIEAQAAQAAADRESSMQEFQIKQQLAQQDAQREQQKIEIESAYKTAELGLAKDRVSIAQQQFAQDTQTAARKFQAIQNYHQRYQQLVDQKQMDPEQAATTAALEAGPEMTGGVMSSAISARRPAVQPRATYSSVTIGEKDSSGRKAGVWRFGSDGSEKWVHDLPGLSASQSATQKRAEERLVDSEIKTLETGQFGMYLRRGENPPAVTRAFLEAKLRYDTLIGQRDKLEGNDAGTSAVSGAGNTFTTGKYHVTIPQ